MSRSFLPYDFARCANDACAMRAECWRWTAREEVGERTPFVLHDGDGRGCDDYLPVPWEPKGKSGTR